MIVPCGLKYGLIGNPTLLGLVWTIALAVMPVLASENLLRLELANGQEIEINRFAGDGEATLLWLPSKPGFSDAHHFHARAPAGLGHEVWLVDLQATCFVQPGRSSIGQFPFNDVVVLIEAAAGTCRIASANGL